MLNKSFRGLNKPIKLTTVLLLVAILGFIALAVPATKAAVVINPKFTLNPTAGAVGSTVFITGTGFSPAEPATFVCTNNQMFSPALYADADGKISGNCTVPDFPAGTYKVVAYDSSGMKISTAFTVTGGGSSTASPSPTSSSSSNGNGNGNGNNGGSNGNGNGNGNGLQTIAPTGASSSSGFFSSTVIYIIVAVLVAFVVSGTFLYSRSSRQKMMLERERERDRERTPYGSEPPQGPYGPGPSGQPSGYGYGPQPSSYGPAPSSPAGSSRYTPYNYRSQSSSSSYQSRYNQPSSYRPSAYASRYSQPSSYRQPQSQSSYSRPAMHSKTCSHCKRSVREDQNICPYCNKRV